MNEIRIGETGFLLDVDIEGKFCGSLPECKMLRIIILRVPFFPQWISCFVDLKSCFYVSAELGLHRVDKIWFWVMS